MWICGILVLNRSSDPHADGEVLLIGDEIHLLDSNGSVLHIAKNDGKPVRNPSPTPTSSNVTVPFQTGWIAYAGWSNTGASPIKSFHTTWKVPKKPTAWDGQTVFLFNSIEPAAGNAILQPVLQFGNAGEQYWAVASWYVVGSQSYHTTFKKVAVGKSLTGVMELTGHTAGNPWKYTSAFAGMPATKLKASSADELVWATETLEAYSITKKADYPVGSTVFSDINIRTKAGTPSVTWSASSDAADGIKTTVNKQGATNAKITIKY